MRRARAAARTRTQFGTAFHEKPPLFDGSVVALLIGMVWFLEKDADLMACEVRRSAEGDYLYEVTEPGGQVRVMRFDKATPFLDGYLREQRELRRNGWRPRMLRTS